MRPPAPNDHHQDKGLQGESRHQRTVPAAQDGFDFAFDIRRAAQDGAWQDLRDMLDGLQDLPLQRHIFVAEAFYDVMLAGKKDLVALFIEKGYTLAPGEPTAIIRGMAATEARDCATSQDTLRVILQSLPTPRIESIVAGFIEAYNLDAVMLMRAARADILFEGRCAAHAYQHGRQKMLEFLLDSGAGAFDAPLLRAILRDEASGTPQERWGGKVAWQNRVQKDATAQALLKNFDRDLESGAVFTPDSLTTPRQGENTPLLAVLCGCGRLEDLFRHHQWRGRMGELEQVYKALAPYGGQEIVDGKGLMTAARQRELHARSRNRFRI